MQEGGYPAGAQYDRRAPWMQPELSPVDVEVDIVMTISKRATITVDDYQIDDDGKIYIGDDVLYKEVQRQIQLPTTSDQYTDWTVEDFFTQNEEAL